MGSMQLEKGPIVKEREEPITQEEQERLQKEKAEARNKPVDPETAALKKSLLNSFRASMANGSEVILNAGGRVIANNLSSQLVRLPDGRMALTVGNSPRGKVGVELLPPGFDSSKTDDPQTQKQFIDAYIKAYNQTTPAKIQDAKGLRIADGRDPAAGFQPIHPRRSSFDSAPGEAPDNGSTPVTSKLLVTNGSSVSLVVATGKEEDAEVKSYNFQVSPYGSVALVDGSKLIQVPGLSLRGLLPPDQTGRGSIEQFVSQGDNREQLQMKLLEFVLKRQ